MFIPDPVYVKGKEVFEEVREKGKGKKKRRGKGEGKKGGEAGKVKQKERRIKKCRSKEMGPGCM
jgi:hypothetical protein